MLSFARTGNEAPKKELFPSCTPFGCIHSVSSLSAQQDESLGRSKMATKTQICMLIDGGDCSEIYTVDSWVKSERGYVRQVDSKWFPPNPIELFQKFLKFVLDFGDPNPGTQPSLFTDAPPPKNGIHHFVLTTSVIMVCVFHEVQCMGSRVAVTQRTGVNQSIVS
jgi:hypothetical protein